MHVIATAGHVDHGKSALLRALTGIEPDRLPEEQSRGLTIELGFAWTRIGAETFAFVDVPGHERFIATMLAGVGPAPAALFVVAADEGWMPQSTEHLAALHAFGVRDGILVISKSDRADPGRARAEAEAHLRRTSLAGVATVAVSARTGAGLDGLRRALLDLAGRRRPEPATAAPIRLWVDRRFTIRGAGTVVTGTLPEGTISVGDTLRLATSGEEVAVRGIQQLGEPVSRSTGPARVALNLRGKTAADLVRGQALVTPGTVSLVSVVDVRLVGTAEDGPDGAWTRTRTQTETQTQAQTRTQAQTQTQTQTDTAGSETRVPSTAVVHIGSASVEAHIRPLGPRHARLQLREELPLRLGDRMLLREGRTVRAGAIALDLAPPPFRRRGDAARRGAELDGYPDRPDAAFVLRRHGVMRSGDLIALGLPGSDTPRWQFDEEHVERLRSRLAELMADRDRAGGAGLTTAEAAELLGLPDPELVRILIAPPAAIRNGVLTTDGSGLTVALRRALQGMSADGFRAWSAAELRELGLGRTEVAQAVAAGAVVRMAQDSYALEAAFTAAIETLAGVPQPFTVSQARQALGAARRDTIPLLEHLAATGRSRVHADHRHEVVTGR